MSSKPNPNSRLDKLDMILNSLKEHERELRRIVEHFESILEKGFGRSQSEVFTLEREESQRISKRLQDKEGVIFISGNKTLLITKEELPKLLQAQLGSLVEYKVDTVEERNALEELLAVLERRERKKRTTRRR